jgi:hypothetical protein
MLLIQAGINAVLIVVLMWFETKYSDAMPVEVPKAKGKKKEKGKIN